MYTRIDHIALQIKNLEVSVAFYRDHFGFEVYAQDVVSNGKIRIAYLRLGDSLLELLEHPEGPFNGFHFCIQTTDFNKAVETLLAKGIKIHQMPHDTKPRSPAEKTWRRVVFEGPDKELVEIRGPVL